MPNEEYIRNQKYFKVSIGDKVTIFRKPTENEWDLWDCEMDEAIGKSGTVIKVSDIGILVKIPGMPGLRYQESSWYYPYTCMRIVR